MEAENEGNVAAGILMVSEAGSLEMPLLKKTNRLERRGVGYSVSLSRINCSKKGLKHSLSLT